MTWLPGMYSPKDWKLCPDCGVTMPPEQLKTHKPEQCERWKREVKK